MTTAPPCQHSPAQTKIQQGPLHPGNPARHTRSHRVYPSPAAASQIPPKIPLALPFPIAPSLCLLPPSPRTPLQQALPIPQLSFHPIPAQGPPSPLQQGMLPPGQVLALGPALTPPSQLSLVSLGLPLASLAPARLPTLLVIPIRQATATPLGPACPPPSQTRAGLFTSLVLGCRSPTPESICLSHLLLCLALSLSHPPACDAVSFIHDSLSLSIFVISLFSVT